MNSTESNDQPSEEVLRKIEQWDAADFEGLMAYVRDNLPIYGRMWPICYDGENKVITWNLATGGWSGCELIVDALTNNKLFWARHWWSSTRGGFYQFKK